MAAVVGRVRCVCCCIRAEGHVAQVWVHGVDWLEAHRRGLGVTVSREATIGMKVARSRLNTEGVGGGPTNVCWVLEVWTVRHVRVG